MLLLVVLWCVTPIAIHNDRDWLWNPAHLQDSNIETFIPSHCNIFALYNWLINKFDSFKDARFGHSINVNTLLPQIPLLVLSNSSMLTKLLHIVQRNVEISLYAVQLQLANSVNLRCAKAKSLTSSNAITICKSPLISNWDLSTIHQFLLTICVGWRKVKPTVLNNTKLPMDACQQISIKPQMPMKMLVSNL